jgi:pantothenate kinase
MPCGNYHIPEALDTELLLEHLRALKSGQAVNLPIYDRFNNQRTEFYDKVESQPVVIVEGIFALHHPELLELYDGKSTSKPQPILFGITGGRFVTFKSAAILKRLSLRLEKRSLCQCIECG